MVSILSLLLTLMSQNVSGGDCLKSQIFLSENRESASGLVLGYGLFQLCEGFSDNFFLGEPVRKVTD